MHTGNLTLGPTRDSQTISQSSKTCKHRNNRFDPLKVSPKFGSPEHSKLIPHSTKNFSRIFKGKCVSDTAKHSKENSKSFHGRIHPCTIKSHHEEKSILSIANETTNKSCDYKKKDYEEYIRLKRNKKGLYETNSSYNVCDNSHNTISSKAQNISKPLAESEITEEEFCERMKVMLKKIKNKSSHGRRVNALFEEVILRDKVHGKILRRIKEFYEWEVAQLNERVGRHDIKCKEYKKALEKCKRAKNEKDKKYERTKIEIKKQKEYIEGQTKMIKDLKGRLEKNNYVNSFNFKYLQSKDTHIDEEQSRKELRKHFTRENNGCTVYENGNDVKKKYGSYL